jgi:hypothetical protein
MLVSSGRSNACNPHAPWIDKNLGNPCGEIKVQESDSKLEATKYEIKARISEMAAATPFSGMDTENTYRHIRHFMTL